MALPRVIRHYGKKLYADANQLNIANIRTQLSLVTRFRDVIDLGCGDGQTTAEIVRELKGAHVRGIEARDAPREFARQLGIDALCTNLDQRLPFDDAAFDIVFSNQVIEHLADTDHFIAETYRILRPGGLAVISTENMASWHNIVALILGLQAFSATNYSMRRYPLGNPIGLHSLPPHEAAQDPLSIAVMEQPGMQHRRIFTTKALCELIEAHGFAIADVRGSGYYPLPAKFGAYDTSHAHFISVAGKKIAGELKGSTW